MTQHLELISTATPRGKHSVVIMDQASWHQTHLANHFNNLTIIHIPPYSPELNPAERVWKEIKSKISMKVFDTLDILENKVIDITNSLGKKEIKSLTNYSYIKNTCSELFNT